MCVSHTSGIVYFLPASTVSTACSIEKKIPKKNSCPQVWFLSNTRPLYLHLLPSPFRQALVTGREMGWQRNGKSKSSRSPVHRKQEGRERIRDTTEMIIISTGNPINWVLIILTILVVLHFDNPTCICKKSTEMIR